MKVIRNINRARNLAEGLQGQKVTYLRNLVFSKKTKDKFRPIHVWSRNARYTLRREERLNEAADKF